MAGRRRERADSSTPKTGYNDLMRDSSTSGPAEKADRKRIRLEVRSASMGGSESVWWAEPPGLCAVAVAHSREGDDSPANKRLARELEAVGAEWNGEWTMGCDAVVALCEKSDHFAVRLGAVATAMGHREKGDKTFAERLDGLREERRGELLTKGVAEIRATPEHRDAGIGNGSTTVEVAAREWFENAGENVLMELKPPNRRGVGGKLIVSVDGGKPVELALPYPAADDVDGLLKKGADAVAVQLSDRHDSQIEPCWPEKAALSAARRFVEENNRGSIWREGERRGYGEHMVGWRDLER